MENKNYQSKEAILELYNSPLLELIYKAATVHRENHDPSEVQLSSLISIKTGGCPEDCGYCPQSAKYNTEVEPHKMMEVCDVVEQAKNAKANGASRLCMGAAWKNIRDNRDFDKVVQMVQEVTNLDMEVCCTLGMMSEDQAKRLKNAGLYAYNHNLDSSREFYKDIISTREYDERLETIDNAKKAGISVCSGGILGMGESIEDRIGMLQTYQMMDTPPDSIPINALVAVEGTPLEEQEPVPIWDMIRMIATTRILFPTSIVRLSAGRTQMSKEGQALCFMAGASSIFAGDKLLTTPNPEYNDDMELFSLLGLKPTKPFHKGDKPVVGEDQGVTEMKQKNAEKEERLAAKSIQFNKAGEDFKPRKFSEVDSIQE
ncbi:MAG: biotin synthase BioB [Crocinitomicaceae bacterium]